MRSVRWIAPAAWLAITALVGGCGGADSLYGTPGAGGDGGSATGTTSTGTGTTSTGSGGTGTGTAGAGGGTAGGSVGGAPCAPVGHDEDGDTVDDACDSCPSYPNTPQVDGDQDGLGNACEAPADPALWQKVASFESFVAAPGASWELGDFTHAPDELVVVAPYGGRNADWLTPLSGLYSVETTFAYDDNEAGWAGVRFAIGETWWGCLVHRVWTLDGHRYDLGLWEFPGSGSQQVLLRSEQQDVGAEPADRPRRVRVHVRQGGSVLCTYDDTDGRHGEIEAQAGNADGLVGLRAYDTQARFFSFVVYQ